MRLFGKPSFVEHFGLRSEKRANWLSLSLFLSSSLFLCFFSVTIYSVLLLRTFDESPNIQPKEEIVNRIEIAACCLFRQQWKDWIERHYICTRVISTVVLHTKLKRKLNNVKLVCFNFVLWVMSRWFNIQLNRKSFSQWIYYTHTHTEQKF